MDRLHNNSSYRDVFRASGLIVRADREDIFAPEVDAETRKLGAYLASRTGAFLTALAQLGGVVEDMETVEMMLRRYPWHGTSITKAKHLELNWFLFQNLCYTFKEKMKLCFNAQKDASRILNLDQPSWLKPELKVVDVELGKAIADRGNTVHSWNVRNDDLRTFEIVEFLHISRKTGEEFDMPEGLKDISGHYFEAKRSLREKSKRLEVEARKMLLRIVEFHAPKPYALLSEFNTTVERVNRKEIKLMIR